MSDTQTTTQATPLAVNVTGFLRGGLGLGEAARLYVAALQAGGVPVRTTTVDVRLPEVAGAKEKVVEFSEMGADLETSFNLVCVNAPELPAFAADVGPEFFEGQRTIGVWAWEVDRIPADWAPAFPLVDEIWVYSHYVAEIISRAAMVPVVRVPLPVIRPVVPEGTVLDLGLPDQFTFLFLFDFYSTLVRKNPLGLIEAFKRAFEPGEGPQLVLKSHNGDYKPERLASVLGAIGDRPDIHLVDRFLSPAEKNALMDWADCYVSLHRAEGFGLTLAEAMALGKPVIATGYSANTDFMTPANSYLVEHGFTSVGPEGENYPADGTWAEPDLDHAAALMREVFEDQEKASARGQQARADIEEGFSVEAVGRVARRRLEHLALSPSPRTPGLAAAATSPNGRTPETTTALEWAELKLTFDPERAAAETPGRKGMLRRLILRVMRPFTHHQTELNTATVRALRELAERVSHVTLQADTLTRLEQRHAERLNLLDDYVDHLLKAGLDADGRADLTRLIAGARARPASTHPAISFTNRLGRREIGFDRTAEAEAEAGKDVYRDFEDIFRGSEEEIRERQERYVALFKGRDWVADLGCGRGELLDDLRENGIAGRGVDLDEGMVRRAREKGHEVEHADAIAWLRSQDDDSVPAVFGAQLIEHLPNDALVELIELLECKLTPGGFAILETVNPHNPAALKAFWTDTTHQHPLFPEVIVALCRIAGFVSARVLLTQETENFDRDIYESPDYAVLATKRAAPVSS